MFRVEMYANNSAVIALHSVYADGIDPFAVFDVGAGESRVKFFIFSKEQARAIMEGACRMYSAIEASELPEVPK